MKKLIIAAVILIACTAQTFAGPIVTIRIEIGRLSLGCDRFGLCNITVDQVSRTASMQVDENTNSLLLNIAKEVTVGKEEYFKGQVVSFEEPVVLSASLLKALGVRNFNTIAVGTYKLTSTRLGYQISIPLP